MLSIQALRTLPIALATTLAIGVASFPSTAVAIGEDPAPSAARVESGPQQADLPALMLKDALVLEDREGYNSEYIFGMTKAVVNSTLHPALKPLLSIITVPLDIVGLPFAVLLGAL